MVKWFLKSCEFLNSFQQNKVMPNADVRSPIMRSKMRSTNLPRTQRNAADRRLCTDRIGFDLPAYIAARIWPIAPVSRRPKKTWLPGAPSAMRESLCFGNVKTLRTLGKQKLGYSENGNSDKTLWYDYLIRLLFQIRQNNEIVQFSFFFQFLA